MAIPTLEPKHNLAISISIPAIITLCGVVFGFGVAKNTIDNQEKCVIEHKANQLLRDKGEDEFFFRQVEINGKISAQLDAIQRDVGDIKREQRRIR